MHVKTTATALLTGLLLAAGGASTASAAADPACGYDVYRGTLTVTSLAARGDVHVWLRGRDTEVRKLRFVKAGETESYRLKRQHTADDFQIAIEKRGTRHDHEHLDWCEPA